MPFATRSLMFVSLLLLTMLVSTHAADYDHSPTIGPAKGWLVIVGGGEIKPEVRDRFVASAGGTDAKFVVIPTAGQDGEIDPDKIRERFSRNFGVTHVTVLHTRDRKTANSKE